MFAWECVPELKALWLARLVGKVCGDTILNYSVDLALTHCHSTCSVIFSHIWANERGGTHVCYYMRTCCVVVLSVASSVLFCVYAIYMTI